MPDKTVLESAAPPSKGLEKTFDPTRFEQRWYERWERDGRFQPQGPAGSPRFVMVIPPPNVTGSLHIGHAYERRSKTSWPLEADARVPRAVAAGYGPRGHRHTDGGGAAAREGRDQRRDLGRGEFEERVWKWRCEIGRHDPGPAPQAGLLPRLVARALHARPGPLARRAPTCSCSSTGTGLIYRGRYIVNWCPRCETALSDLEVEHRESRREALPHPVSGRGRRRGIAVVATTRPETMLGDTARRGASGRRALPRPSWGTRSCCPS